MTFLSETGRSKLDNSFSYHPPKNDTQKRGYEEIRVKAKELALLIYEYQGESREASLAITNIEQAVMWANAGIARNT